MTNQFTPHYKRPRMPLDKKVIDVFRSITENVDGHIVECFRKIAPESVSLTEPLCKALYNESVRIFQSQKNKGGKKLESVIEDILREQDIPFLAQAYVDEASGGITQAHKPKSCFQPDIIPFAKEGDHISDHVYISIKRSLRERWRQDANKSCQCVYLITFDTISPNMRSRMKSLNLVPIVVGDNTYNIDYLVDELHRLQASRMNLE